jgi:hypothetical protein
MRDNTLEVVAVPQTPEYNNVGHFWDMARAATHAVIKDHAGAPAVLQPLSTDLVPAEWHNMMGGTLTGQGIVARFDLAAFKALPWKDVELVIITSKGEKSCTLSEKDRAPIQYCKVTQDAHVLG